MTPIPDSQTIKFAIPKGRMYDAIVALLAQGGIRVRTTSRDYRPAVNLPGVDVKILKPRAIIEMLDTGARDLAFAGADWVAESDADLVELLDTGLDPVRLVAAAPTSILAPDGTLPDRPLVVASEYVRLARRWIQQNNLNATVLPSYGATEVLPPEDADCIIDNTATGATLEANNLRIIDQLATSSSRLYASRAAMESDAKRPAIERITMLVHSVLEARSRVMLECNVPAEKLAPIIDALPCMREPTIARLHADSGYAVKAAVPRAQLTEIIPALRVRGGTDIVVTSPQQIVP